MDLGETFLEFGFAQRSAAVEVLVVADLLPGMPENLLADRQAARRDGRDEFEGANLHEREYAKSAARGVGW